jgi:hypothetical protein
LPTAFIEQRVNGVMVGVDAVFVSRRDHYGRLSHGGRLCRADSERRKASRLADSADSKIRVGNQSPAKALGITVPLMTADEVIE